MRKTKFNIQEYSAFAACFLLIQDEGAAEAVYTDIADTVINYNAETFWLDLDDNGTFDFSLQKQSFSFLVTTYYSGYITSHFSAIFANPKVSGNKIAGSTASWGGSEASTFIVHYPYALIEGQPVNDSLSFQDDANQNMAFRYRGSFSSYVAHGGHWYPEILDHYLGVYFKDSTECYHYGWIRCDVKNNGRELTVKDFAYETKCDIGLLAGDTIGDTSTDVDIINNLNATVYSFGNNVYINLGDIQKTDIKIYNIGGQLIYSDVLSNKFLAITLNQPASIYMVELVSKEKKYSKKIYLE